MPPPSEVPVTFSMHNTVKAPPPDALPTMAAFGYPLTFTGASPLALARGPPCRSPPSRLNAVNRNVSPGSISTRRGYPVGRWLRGVAVSARWLDP